MFTGKCHCGSAYWEFDGDLGSITACNCTLCHRLGALWAYDFENERIRLVGKTASYRRKGKANPTLEILFCPTCACTLSWRGLEVGVDGKRRMAVNVRLTELANVSDLPIDHFEGLDSFEDLPSDGKCVRDLWF